MRSLFLSPSSASLELGEWSGKGKNGAERELSGEGRRSRKRKRNEERKEREDIKGQEGRRKNRSDKGCWDQSMKENRKKGYDLLLWGATFPLEHEPLIKMWTLFFTPTCADNHTFLLSILLLLQHYRSKVEEKFTHFHLLETKFHFLSKAFSTYTVNQPRVTFQVFHLFLYFSFLSSEPMEN